MIKCPKCGAAQNAYWELAIVIVAMLIPTFLLASEVDGDEFAKSGMAVALAGVILGAYKVWQAAKERAYATKPDPNGE